MISNAANTYPQFSLEELQRLLQHLDYNNREVWWLTFAICGRYFNHDSRAFNMLQQWSSQYSGRKASDAKQEQTEFYSSSNRDGAGIGTLIEMAKASGYKPSNHSIVHEHDASPRAQDDMAVPFIIRKGNVDLRGFESDIDDMFVLGCTVIVYLASDAQGSERASIFAKYAKYAKYFPDRLGPCFEALCVYSRQNPDQFSTIGFRDYLLQTHAIEGFTLDEFRTITMTAKACSYNSCIEFLTRIKTMYSRMVMHKKLMEMVAINHQDKTPDGLAVLDKLIDLYYQFSGSEEFPIMNAAELGLQEQASVLDLADPEARKEKFIPTGYKEIDDKVWGFKRNEISYIAGHSGVGKTCSMIDFIMREAKGGNHCLAIHTEMDKSAVAQRNFNIAFQVGPIEYTSKGHLSQIYAKFLTTPELKNIYCMDAVGADINAIENGIAQWQWMVGGKGRIVFIDYLQNIANKDYGNSHTQNYERIRDVSRRLKTIAVRYGVAMVVLAQLNNPNQNGRSNSSSVDVYKAPNAFDFAGSTGCIQEAGLVLTMYKVDLSAESASHEEAFSGYYGRDIPQASDGKVIRMQVVKSRYSTGVGESIDLYRSLGGGFYSAKTPSINLRDKN